MDFLVISLRLVHIVLGSIWVGGIFINTVFLAPVIGELGPDGGKVMAALQRRGMLTLLPLVALGTILSGLWLYWEASVAFHHHYHRTGPGHFFGIGGLAAIAAFLIGIGVMRPAMLRIMGLAQGMAQLTTDGERMARQQEIQALRARATTAGRVVLVLLLLATAAMAVGRYM